MKESGRPRSEGRHAARAEHAPQAPRRPYRSPALTEYGSVAKLTQGSLTWWSDGSMGGFRFMMLCL
jgi:hypothetical protein